MKAFSKLVVVFATVLTALALVAGPVAASVDDAPVAVEAEVPADGGEESGRPAVADTPRDRVGLILYALLIAAGVLALANARRQLKGERPQATGEFRWR